MKRFFKNGSLQTSPSKIGCYAKVYFDVYKVKIELTSSLRGRGLKTRGKERKERGIGEIIPRTSAIRTPFVHLCARWRPQKFDCRSGNEYLMDVYR